jgi:hypothetical protein
MGSARTPYPSPPPRLPGRRDAEESEPEPDDEMQDAPEGSDIEDAEDDVTAAAAELVNGASAEDTDTSRRTRAHTKKAERAEGRA